MHNRIEVFVGDPATQSCPRHKTDANVLEADEAFLGTCLFHNSAQRREFLELAFRRLQGGDRCFVILDGGRFAGYGWATSASPHPVTEVDLPLPLGRNDLVLYDFLVLSEFRRRGLYPALLEGIRSLIPNKRLLIYAERHNTRSLKGIRKAGFEYLFSMERLRLIGISFRVRRVPVGAQR